MTDLKLKTAIGNYGHVRALKDGTLRPRDIELEHVEVEPIINAFRRMVRTLEFQVSEMAITTYLCARDHGKPFTAIPVFVLRNFAHSGMTYNQRSGIREPQDLEGKRMGVRAYTVTSGAWARGILASEYGVPFLGSIPMGIEVREGGDKGVPVVVGHPESPQAQAFRKVAEEVARQVSIEAMKPELVVLRKSQ